MRKAVWGRAILLGTALGLVAAPVAFPARAQTATQGQAAQQAFDIPAQPLSAALDTFARNSGWQVGYPAVLAQGKTSTALGGRFAPPEALGRLLTGTGLTYRITGTNTVTLVEAPQGGNAAVLPTITVEGQPPLAPMQETAWGPGQGYVAKRTAFGSKTDTPLNEVPQSISVVTKEQIEIQKAQTVGDALRYTPGVIKQQGYNRTDDGLMVRGFQALEGGIYVDGMRAQPNVYSSVSEPYGLERIDVLRGPASVLFGQANPGGLVNLVTKRPTMDPLHEIEVQGGNFNRKQIATDHGDALNEQRTLGYRFVALVRESDTMVDYVNDDRVFIAPSLTFQPNDDTSLTILTQYSRSDTKYNYGYPTNGTVNGTPAGLIPSNRFIGEPDFNYWHRTTYSAGYLFEHRLNETFQMRQNLRYAEFENDLQDINTVAQVSTTTISRLPLKRLDRSDIITVDNQLQSDFDTGPVKHTLLTGLDYMHGTFNRMQRNGTTSNLNLYDPVYGSPVTLGTALSTASQRTASDQRGLYVQDQIKYEQWVLLLGGRRDWAEDKVRSNVNNSTALVESNATTGRAGLVYLFENGISPYASYTESFQPQTNLSGNGQVFQPTTGEQYEIGFKYQPPGYTSSITMAAFDLTRQNVTSNSVGSTTQYQTGEINSRGYEISAVANLTNGLSLIGAYTRTDADVTKSRNNTLGTKPENTPDEMVSLWADYKVQEGALQGLRFGGGARYVGESYNTASTTLGNTAKVSGYTVYDAMMRYGFGAWELGLNVVNLFDKQYIASCTYACFYGDTRTVIGNVTYRW